MDTAVEVNLNGVDAESPPTQAVIGIDKIGIETMLVPIIGTAPLIVNRFSEKARR